MSNTGALIFTSSWFTNLDPDRYCRIGISRGVPRGMSGYHRYAKLYPGPWFRDLDADRYARRYYDDILAPLDPETVVRELQEMAAGRIPVLLCWEPAQPGSAWCHRGMVSKWLFDKLALPVLEIGFESEGCGHSHPKLPPSQRQWPRDLFSRK